MEDVKRITSAANPTVKKLKSLAVKKYRDEEGLFMVEGLRHTQEAVAAGWPLRYLVYAGEAAQEAQELIKSCLKFHGQVLEVTQDILSRITGRDNAQAVLGVFPQRWSDIVSAQKGLWVVLEGVRDPGNLGTILRTCDAVGARGVILVGNTCDLWSPEVIRATMGSFARIGTVRATHDAFMAWRKTYRGKVVGTHLNAAAKDYREIPSAPDLLLVMGSEQSGLTPAMTEACDILARIPMRGGAESLNLGVSTGIMLYEICRDRS